MTDPAPRRINKLPAARGLAWFVGSWELIRRQPIRLLLISLFVQLFLSFSQVDTVGLLIVMCLPAISAGVLQAFHVVEQGEKPALAVLFIPFTVRDATGRLLLLGGLVLVLSLLLTSLMLAGQMMEIEPQLLERIEQGDLDALQHIDPKIIESTLFSIGLSAAVGGILTYFSVPLIWFRKETTAAAVLLGLKAMGRNWKPLLLVGCLLGLLAVPIVLLSGSFYLSALNEEATSSWLALVLVFLGPLFQLLLLGTQYLAFRDIFGVAGQSDCDRRSNRDQLVA